MNRPGRVASILAISIGALLVIGVSGYFLAIRALDKAFAKADCSPIEISVKKGLADIFVIKRSPGSTATPFGGYLKAYEN